MYISEKYINQLDIQEGILSDTRSKILGIFRKNIVTKYGAYIRRGINEKKNALKTIKDAGLDPNDITKMIFKEFKPVAKEISETFKTGDLKDGSARIKKLSVAAASNVSKNLSFSLKSISYGISHAVTVAIGLLAFFACAVIVILTLCTIPTFAFIFAGKLHLLLSVAVAIYGGLIIELEREDSRADDSESVYLFASTLVRIAAAALIPGSVVIKIITTLLSILANYSASYMNKKAETENQVFIVQFSNWILQAISIFMHAISITL